MSITGDKNSLNDCGCCELDSLEYPEHYNRPGQDAINYRLDTHSGFVSRMLARLSRDQITGVEEDKQRPLVKLTTHNDDDPTVAILDAWAVVADVLTFYQERIANEAYIRTATERRSVFELARTIGYELNPGVAASTWLAFTADNSPGSPPSARVPKGTQVLSIPGKDEVPQTFETTEEITARAEWNSLMPYTVVETKMDPVVLGVTQLRLKGTGTGLQPGDGILIVGDEKIQSSDSEYWDFRILAEVIFSPDGESTLVKWERGLGHVQPAVTPAASNVMIYAFAVNTAIFGKNAAEWQSLHSNIRAEYLEKLLGQSSNISVSKNGKRMVFAGNNNSLRIWTYLSSQNRWVKESVDIDTTGAISCVAVSSYGTTIVLGHSDGALSKLRKSSGTWNKQPIPSSGVAHESEVKQVAFSTTGNYVVSLAVDKIEKIWNSVSRTWVKSYIPHMTVTVSGKKYRVGSDGQALGYWQLNSSWSETIISSQAHDDLISSMAISSDDAQKVISGGADGTLRIWTLSNGTWSSQEFHDEYEEAAHTGPVIRVAFSNDNIEVISTSMNKIIRRWRVSDQTLLRTFKSETLDYLTEWPDFDLIVDPENPKLSLEEHYPGIVYKSWIVLSKPSYVEAYNVTKATKTWHSEFNISSDVTQLELDGFEHLNWFGRRDTEVFVQSMLLQLYEKKVPKKLPIEGDKIELDRLTPELETERMVVISGQRMRARITASAAEPDGDTPEECIGATELELESSDHLTTKCLFNNDNLLVMSRPKPETEGYGIYWVPSEQGFVPRVIKYAPDNTLEPDKQIIKWQLQDRNGFIGMVTADTSEIMLIPSEKDDETISEVGLIDALFEREHNDRLIINSLLQLNNALANIYDHDSVSINANVAPASHGETVPLEVIGSGNGTSVNQRFILNKNPLTYISAPTPTGGESTLEVRVNDVLWKQVPSLYEQGPRSQGYTIRHDNDGNSIITFGDGRQGARLPTGQENIVAAYRSGIGSEGEVGSKTLRLLKSKPLGIREVTNPLSATGAAPPEVLEDARAHAPLTVLTLDRIVSVNDFEDFAAAFAGVGKAQATVLWNGETNVVHITIATASGGKVNENDILRINILYALSLARDTTVQVLVDGHIPIHFTVKAQILIDSRYLWKKVEADVKDALQAAFTFEKRAFGQGVNEVEALTIINGVEGVVAADLVGEKLSVVELNANIESYTELNMLHLRAKKARWEPKDLSKAVGAQLLLISSSVKGVTLERMPA